ncbi:MAG: tetratricopeptide repeat protein [Calditrichaeota bacterium]|nr:tetratricopeptide repeat protein [Calditrichota bacterium]
MIRHWFGVLSADVPGGFWVWIALILIGWFTAWFVYRTSELVDRRKFTRWLVWIFILSIFIYGGLWWVFRPPARHERVALATPGGFRIDPSHPENYAVQYETFLKLSRWLPPDRFIVYSPDWVYRIIPKACSTRKDSIRSFLKRMKVDRLIWIRWRPESHQLVWVSEELRRKIPGKSQTYSGKTVSAALENGLRDFYTDKDSLKQLARLQRVDFQATPDQWRQFARGKLQLLTNDLTGAEKTFQGILTESPQSCLGWVGLAESHLQRVVAKQALGGYLADDLASAYSAVVNARNAAPNWSLVHLLEGKYYIFMEIWSKAQESLFKSYRLYPNSDALYIALSRLHPSRLRKIGFYSIRQTLHRAVFMNPASIPAHLLMADVLYRQHDLAEAEKQYKELLAFNPDLKDGLMELGKFYINTTNYAGARRIFQRLVRQDSTDAISIYNLGVIAFLEARPDEAIPYFEKALAVGHVVNSYLYLAKIYEQKGETDRAISFLRKRIHFKSGPNDPFAEEARKHLVVLLNRKAAK